MADKAMHSLCLARDAMIQLFTLLVWTQDVHAFLLCLLLYIGSLDSPLFSTEYMYEPENLIGLY